MKTIIPVPDGFSVDLPNFSLIVNISPFPVIKPVLVVSPSAEVYEIEDHLVWVKLDKNHFGLFNRKQLNIHRCPTCGQEWKHEGE
jgi:hypothetical protein